MIEISRLRLLAAALALLVAAACFRGTLPPLEKYRLALPGPTPDPTDSGPVALPAVRPLLPGSIAIAPYRTIGIYGDPNIVYRIDDHRYGTYPAREWALPLALMLGHITERVLQAHPLSIERAIYSPPTRLAHPYEWQGIVRHFEEVNRGRDVLVAVAFDARLVRTADEVVVWQGSVAFERPVEGEPTMSAIVQALSSGAAEAVAQLIAEARTALERAPPTAGR